MARPKDIGTRFENQVRDDLKEYDSYRCGEIVGHPGDVSISFAVVDQETDKVRLDGYFLECKKRKDAWKELYSWLDKNKNDFLALRANYERTLIVMDMDQFKVLLRGEMPRPRRDP